MRKINNWLAASIGFLIGVLLFGIAHLHYDLKIDSKNKDLEYLHTRDSLVIDSLLKPFKGTDFYYEISIMRKGWPVKPHNIIDSLVTENKELQAQIGWYEAQWSKESED